MTLKSLQSSVIASRCPRPIPDCEFGSRRCRALGYSGDIRAATLLVESRHGSNECSRRTAVEAACVNDPAGHRIVEEQIEGLLGFAASAPAVDENPAGPSAGLVPEFFFRCHDWMADIVQE